jgi:hypothetical protein
MIKEFTIRDINWVAKNAAEYAHHDSWKGSYHPDTFVEIEAELALTREKLIKKFGVKRGKHLIKLFNLEG